MNLYPSLKAISSRIVLFSLIMFGCYTTSTAQLQWDPNAPSVETTTVVKTQEVMFIVEDGADYLDPQDVDITFNNANDELNQVLVYAKFEEGCPYLRDIKNELDAKPTLDEREEDLMDYYIDIYQSNDCDQY